MAQVSYEDLLPYVKPYVPECPEFVVLTHLAEAAARFCEESYVWVMDIEDETTILGEDIYEIDVPTGTVLEDVKVLELDRTSLIRVTEAKVPLSVSDTPGLPRWYSLHMDTSVRLYPTPDKAYVFRGRAILKPALDSTTIERFLYSAHGRAIATGAIAQLAAIPGKAWTNPALAMQYNQKFDNAVASARVRDNRTINERVQPRPIA